MLHTTYQAAASSAAAYKARWGGPVSVQEIRLEGDFLSGTLYRIQTVEGKFRHAHSVPVTVTTLEG